MAKRFMNYKYRLHMHCKKFYTPEEAKENPPLDVKEEDWIALYGHFEEEAFKAQSAANTGNRKQLEVLNTSGSKSYYQRLYELENSKETNEELDTPKEPIEMKLYFDTHHKKDGTWIHPQAEENYVQMEAVRAQAAMDGIEVNGRQIFEQVLKTKKYYAHGLGHGVKPRPSRELELEARLHSEKIESEKQAKELEEQI
ncbi:hypothetical protein JCGZ_19449 [Jatropha curcas]|uniref:Uncharacterized protein n=1 Tax=Jatropha curcas TaxID=180498 RepID=A0A067JZA1_JATCU|nr:hypothetical protein JCGZ_19449 [Jatropha curcas]